MLAPSHAILLALIRLFVLNALTGPSDYLSGNPDYSCRNFLTCFPFEFSFTMIGMGDDMSVMAYEVDCCMLERYCHEYHLSPVIGFQVLSSSSSILDAPPGKVGFYLRHLVVTPVSHLLRDWSKCSFHLTTYLAGDIPPESIVVDDVVPRYVFPLSICHVAPKPVGGCPSSVVFDEEPNEAVQKKLSLPYSGVIYRYPYVVRLPFHLPGQQQIVYGEDDDIDDVLDKPSVASSMFTAWMECNAVNGDARKLTYVEFPTKFVWQRGDRIWKPREVGKCIGRIHSVSPNLGEAYFLRILLNKVKGPKSFEEIRTVNGEEYSSFRDVCYALGLLDDDKEYIDAIKEASHSGSGFYLRFLFATLLMCNSMSKPEVVWENTWEYLADEILYNQRRRFKSPDLSLNEDQLKNLTLFEIEQVLLRNNSTLKNYKNMPIPDVDSVSSSNNRLITEELDYDIPVMKTEFDRMFLALTNEQRHIFLDIMGAVKENKGSVFFVYGYGGTDGMEIFCVIDFEGVWKGVK
ncbi:unnamed protein product [Lactuca virosa]|uniref:ATP-dependent DNA helicase n=1 Tax=Lactuca virosa TaxID=75947 RepID=A0AAU9NLY3_9ASTR|nr:unnamed protein product [Lactuca virosa]